MSSSAAASPLPADQLWVDRDLSWLDFERRVLELASDDHRPLAERVKLCAIVSSNLDEFFAVRVARLHRRDDMASRSLLHEVRRRVLELLRAQDDLWNRVLNPALHAAGVHVNAATDRSAIAQSQISVVGPGMPFPHLESGEVAAGALTRNGSLVVAVPRRPSARIACADGEWLPIERALARALPGTSVAFRLTRSAELSPAGASSDPLDAVKHELALRRHGHVIRLELEHGGAPSLVQRLTDELGLVASQVYRPAAPIGLGDFRCLVDAIPREREEWGPATPPDFAGAAPAEIFARLRRGDVLVHHPYESFERSVQAFADAARDQHVSAVSATVYRTSRPSGTVAAVRDAAMHGTRAVCVVELRARFDEGYNVESSRLLRNAGVDVVHGAVGTKVHAKLLAIARVESGRTRRYVHVGTGNYHASNAFGYEDLSLFSTDEALAADVEQVFAALAHNVRPGPFRKLLVGPWNLREGLMGEIDSVVRGARVGQASRIRIKVNSIGDERIVAALYDASRAGVDVQLVVRGACTLIPGVPGTSDLITVRSVLGRFLEHSRIFSFESGRSRRVWLGSADLLRRNLDHRVETLAPVEDPRLQDRLEGIFDVLLADTRDAWELDARGTWHRVAPPPGVAAVSAQEAFMAAAARRHRADG